MKKYFKRLPKENEGWKSKSTSKNDNMEKTQDAEDTKIIKRSSSKYRAEKITGFNNQNVNEKIKSMEARLPKGDWCKSDNFNIKTTTLTQILTYQIKETDPKIKKVNAFMNLEEVIPVKKVVAVGRKGSILNEFNFR